MAEKSTGKIITFYSYKGGTGRSMMMANVAWVLACSGMKVLAIDWDLEAPGLHRYFQPFLLDKELTASDGLIDFVFNFALEAVTPNTEELKADWYKKSANILRYALSINYEFAKGGRLDFVPAGRQGIAYAARVNSFDWEKFYDRLGGGVFFEEVKKQMCSEYDYILIDSRTGVSDTSGICTIQMPDILVPCFTLNNQGIDGARRITNTVFEKRRESGIRVFPVPMRLDNAENDKLDRRRKEAKSKFTGFPNFLAEDDFQTYWNEIPVFYVPYYSYEEILAVFAQDRSTISILAAAERLTKYLTNKKIERVGEEALPSEEERRRVSALYAGEVFKENPEAEISRIADNAIAPLSLADRARARRVLMRLIRIAPGREKDKYDRQQVALEKFPLTETSIIERLINSRLLVSSADNATGKRAIQIARKEFLTDWKQLQKWLEEDHEFLPIESAMKSGGEGYEYLKTLLAAGGSMALKVWQIDWRLKYLVRGVLFAAIFLIAYIFKENWEEHLPETLSKPGSDVLDSLAAKVSSLAALLPTLTFNKIAFAVLSLFGGVILLRILASLVGDYLALNIVRLVRWKDTLRRIAVTVFVSTFGFIISFIHLYFFDKLFLRLGSLETLKRKSKKV